MSSDAADVQIDLDRAVDNDFVGDVGVRASAELLAFTNAAHGRGDLETTRVRLLDAVGEDGLIEAAATIAIFNGLVRVADGTGIQLDAGLESASRDERKRLGLDDFAGAANTPTGRSTSLVASIGDLFG